MITCKKSDLTKNKKLDFTNVNFFETDFIISEAKKTFAPLEKAFIKILILYYLKPKYYIWIEINILSYTIYEIIHQFTFDQYFSNHITYINLNFSKFGID